MSLSKKDRLAKAIKIETSLIDDDKIKYGSNISSPMRRLATLIRENIESEVETILCPYCKIENKVSPPVFGPALPSGDYICACGHRWPMESV